MQVSSLAERHAKVQTWHEIADYITHFRMSQGNNNQLLINKITPPGQALNLLTCIYPFQWEIKLGS